MNLLNKNIVNQLIKKKFKISFAESCTGGMLSSTITSICGSSKVFNLGLVTYSNKEDLESILLNANNPLALYVFSNNKKFFNATGFKRK